MPLINHINQSSQIFRPNENRWDVLPSIEFVDANTLEPVTSYNEGDYITLKYDFAPRGIQAIRPGYDYNSDRWYNYVNIYLTLKKPNGNAVSTSGQINGTYRSISFNVNTGEPNYGGSGYLAYGQIVEDIKSDGPLILGANIQTSTRAAGSTYYSTIFLNNYVKLINDNVIINDTSTFPIPRPSTTYTGKYTVGQETSNNYAPHVFQTSYSKIIVQHLFTPSNLTNAMGLTSGAVIKGFGLDWVYGAAPSPSPTYQNSGTQIWIFHADREHFGKYYSDTNTTYYSYSDYQAAPVSGQSKNLIFGLSSTEKELMSSQPDGEFSFGYYDYQLNTNLCSTSFTWNGSDPICLEACIEPKAYYTQMYYVPQRRLQTSGFVTNPNTGNYAYTTREYCTSYTGTYGSSGTNLCGTIPTSRDYSIPEYRFFWD